MSSSLDYLELCRLCLVKENVELPIFEDDGEARQIYFKISSCLPVKVAHDDKLPKKICDQCGYKVELLYQFWNTTVNAEKQLLQWLGDVGELEDKQGYITEVLDSNVMKQERSGDSRLDGSVMQVAESSNIDINMIDNMSIITMPDGSEQQFTTVPIEGSSTVQTVQVVAGSSTQEQANVAEEEEEEDEDNFDDGCDNDDGMTVKEEAEDDQNERSLESTFVNVSLPCDEAGPSGLQQKIANVSEITSQTAEGDSKPGRKRRRISSKRTTDGNKKIVIDNEGNHYEAIVPKTSIIPHLEPESANGLDESDFEEVSIDGRSNSFEPQAMSDPSDNKAVYVCKICEIYFTQKQMLTNHMDSTHPEKSSGKSVLTNSSNSRLKLVASRKKNNSLGFSYVNGTRQYKCRYCNFRTSEKPTMILHATIKHPGVENKSVEVRTPSTSFTIESKHVMEKRSPHENIEERWVHKEEEPELMEEKEAKEEVEEMEMVREKEEFDELDEQVILQDEAPEEGEEQMVLQDDAYDELEDEQVVLRDEGQEEQEEMPEEVADEKEDVQETEMVESMVPEDQGSITYEEIDPTKEEVQAMLEIELMHENQQQHLEAQENKQEQQHADEALDELEDFAPAGMEDGEDEEEGEEEEEVQEEARVLLKQYGCPYCDFESDIRSSMNLHITRKHAQAWQETLEQRLQLEAQRGTGNLDLAHACIYCEFTSSHRATLNAHTRRKHPGFIQPTPERQRKQPAPETMCEQCDFKTNDKRKMLMHVERKHSTEPKYPCETCGKKFKTKVDLSSHVRFQHIRIPAVCDVCGKICYNSNALHVHQKREHYLPEFECHICHRRMVTQENLDDHILRQHEQRNKYQCELCGKVFTQPSKLKQHLMTHTGERPHTCQLCGKAFARRAVYRQHLLIHTGKRPYVCDICGKAFTQKPGLICHRKSHPGSHPPLPVVYIDSYLNEIPPPVEEEE
ncbi:zinc finger protein Xfin isoform X2 [Copidosoma floridanum]|uniref:zinc finger protein Xfin isoform X2 n=1 Tax=Copidosoma floridanum TaxID=29053 RepID=UPI0006C9549C|nr:zinc finger protein Xfin isoform X2 [Copidosoma floridanum]